MKRAQQDLISKDLTHKMVFLTEIRQVGKTSLVAVRVYDAFCPLKKQNNQEAMVGAESLD